MHNKAPQYAEHARLQVERIVEHVQQVIIGKQEAIELVVIAILCGGHVLLEDVPGVGKTMLVRTLAKSIDCSFMRIQFTPDLLPSDVTGVNMYNQKSGQFEFRAGPIMAHIVLADEVNRTSPKTQSALLEAMEEKHITVDGTTYALPEPFIVLATQNPVNFEGTFRLPEAQLDRFMIKIQLGYPSLTDEADMLDRLQQHGHPLERIQSVMFREELVQLQKLAAEVHVDASLKRYIVELAVATRQHASVRLGVSPRGSVALMKVAQGQALMRGRSYVVPDDIKQLVHAVFAHRMVLHSAAMVKGQRSEAILDHIVESVPVPLLQYAAAK